MPRLNSTAGDSGIASQAARASSHWPRCQSSAARSFAASAGSSSVGGVEVADQPGEPGGEQRAASAAFLRDPAPQARSSRGSGVGLPDGRNSAGSNFVRSGCRSRTRCGKFPAAIGTANAAAGWLTSVAQSGGRGTGAAGDVRSWRRSRPPAGPPETRRQPRAARPRPRRARLPPRRRLSGRRGTGPSGPRAIGWPDGLAVFRVMIGTPPVPDTPAGFAPGTVFAADLRRAAEIGPLNPQAHPPRRVCFGAVSFSQELTASSRPSSRALSCPAPCRVPSSAPAVWAGREGAGGCNPSPGSRTRRGSRPACRRRVGNHRRLLDEHSARG